MSKPLGSEKLGVYQVYHDDFSKSQIDPSFQPFFLGGNPSYHEGQAALDLIGKKEHEQSEFFGVLPWQFRWRYMMDRTEIQKLLEANSFESDLYSLVPRREGYNVWKSDPKVSDRLIEIGQTLMEKAGYSSIDLENITTPSPYGSYFVSRSEIYEQFADEMLKPCLSVLDDKSDSPFQKLLNAPLTQGSALKALTFKPVQGIVCEKLVGTWLAMNPWVKIGFIRDAWGSFS